MTERSSLSGEIKPIQFKGGNLADRVYPELREFLDVNGYDITDILILKRFPTGIDDFVRNISDKADFISHPNAQSITRHATNVLSLSDDDFRVLSDIDRIHSLANVIEDYRGEWETDYMASASEQTTFGPDVGRILLAATWSGGFDLDNGEAGRYDALINDLSSLQQRFRDRLDQADESTWIERAETIHRAIEALDNTDIREHVAAECEAIVVVEFEEFGPLERQYLDKLSDLASLHCIGEKNASVARPWNEPGGLKSIQDGLTAQDPVESQTENSPIPQVARFLATGEEVSGVADQESLCRISTEYFEEQFKTIANEIEFLRDEHGWRYDDFAVVLKDSNQPIRRARNILARAGLPVSSASTSGLRDDPAGRELYELATYLAAERGQGVTEDRQQQAKNLLTTRIDEDLESILDSVSAESTIADQLARWIVETNLKHRVASTGDEVTVFTRFQHVKQVLELAEYIDESPTHDNSWSEFQEIFDVAVKYIAPDTFDTELDVEENGVMVDSTRLLKHDERKVVFLVDVVDSVYPATAQLTALFPAAWVKRMDTYPGVTRPSQEDVINTFSTASSPIHVPFDTYYKHLSRRQLAVGARAARDRLYFCTSELGSNGERQHPSRFLEQIESEIDLHSISGNERDHYTTGGVAQRVLSRPETVIDELVNEAMQGNDQDLSLYESELGAIETLLNELDDAGREGRYKQAFRTQIDRTLNQLGEQ